MISRMCEKVANIDLKMTFIVSSEKRLDKFSLSSDMQILKSNECCIATVQLKEFYWKIPRF